MPPEQTKTEATPKVEGLDAEMKPESDALLSQLQQEICEKEKKKSFGPQSQLDEILLEKKAELNNLPLNQEEDQNEDP